MLNTVIKADLHLHSVASSYKEAAGIVDESDVAHLPVLLSKLKEYGINFISFTDHNAFNRELYDAVKAIADDRDNPYGLVGIIPGVEFDVLLQTEKPCHIMAYFDAPDSEAIDKVEKYFTDYRVTDAKYKYTEEEFGRALKGIGLPVLLVAYQRHSIDPSKIDDDNSFSEAVIDALDYIKCGFIDGFDVQKPAVEGIIKSRLHDCGADTRSVGMLMASDCHQWSAYPAHDSGRNPCESFSVIKCLPTFKGLQLALSSPATRFSRVCQEKPTIPYFDLDGKRVELSSGLNAIIGENGAGKSTLLTALSNIQPFDAYVKEILEKSVFSLPDDIVFSPRMVKQAQLVSAYQNRDLIERETGGEYFQSLDLEGFRRTYRQFFSHLIARVKAEIEARKRLDAPGVEIKFDEAAFGKTHRINIVPGQIEEVSQLGLQTRILKLKEIIRRVDDELGADEYVASQVAVLSNVRNQLFGLLVEIARAYATSSITSDAKNVVSNAVARYNERVSSSGETADDKKKKAYEKKKREVLSGVLLRVKAMGRLAAPYPVLPDSKKFEAESVLVNKTGGFEFSSRATFVDLSEEDIESRLYSTLFNVCYAETGRIKQIQSAEDLVEAVKGATTESKVPELLEKHLEAFLAEMTKVKYEIKKQGSKNPFAGSTLGEQALVFFDVYTNTHNAASEVFFFDQPEDNISNNKISEELITYINRLRDENQVFIVTHNPLLVVNLDVDNVIIVSSNPERDGLHLSVESGCLEDEQTNILKTIAEKMDGGREAVEKRLRVYGK